MKLTIFFIVCVLLLTTSARAECPAGKVCLSIQIDEETHTMLMDNADAFGWTESGGVEKEIVIRRAMIEWAFWQIAQKQQKAAANKAGEETMAKIEESHIEVGYLK